MLRSGTGVRNCLGERCKRRGIQGSGDSGIVLFKRDNRVGEEIVWDCEGCHEAGGIDKRP